VNHKRFAALASAGLAATLALAGCGGQDESNGNGGSGSEQKLSGEVRVDGSSTVQPLTAAAGELYKEEQSGVNVSVATSGTGGGFQKFCRGETDISDASRPIKDDAKEKQACTKNSIAYAEIQVANDALTVVVNKENDWVDCLTVAQLKKMWEPAAEKKITSWNQVDPKFPNEKLDLFGAGTDSGTFDYFTAEIVGEEGESRTDYSPSEDDNVTVQGVAGSKGGLGYFGFSYFEENSDKLKAVKIDGGQGCVEPSAETAQGGTYTPLARPLFIYVSKKAYTEKPQVKGFVEFYVNNDQKVTETAQFVPLNEEQRTKAKAAVSSLAAG
jgi:phosphate transport system substrate-binding protein